MDNFEIFQTFVQDIWGAWLMGLFLIAIGWALWPSKKLQAYMDYAARIPFEEDDDHSRADRAQSGG